MSDEIEVSDPVESVVEESQPIETPQDQPNEPLTGESLQREFEQVEKAEREPQEDGPPPVTTPQGIQIPPEFAAKHGVKTLEEWEQRFSASSREAQRLFEENKKFAAQLEAMRQAPQGQPQAPTKPTGYFGFESADAYNKAFEADPHGTMQKVSRWTLQNDPELRKTLGLDKIDKFEQVTKQMEEQAASARTNAQFNEFVTKYSVKAGSPEAELSLKYLHDPKNDWLAEALVQRDVNLGEVVHKLANFDMLEQKVKALEAKQSSARKSAPTARPGTGGTIRAKSESGSRNLANAAAEDYESKHGEKVPDEWIDGVAKAFGN